MGSENKERRNGSRSGIFGSGFAMSEVPVSVLLQSMDLLHLKCGVVKDNSVYDLRVRLGFPLCTVLESTNTTEGDVVLGVVLV